MPKPIRKLPVPNAVLACALVQGVVDPLMCGIGGFGIMHVYDPATKCQPVWRGMGGCPGAASSDMWADIYLGETSDGFGFIVKDHLNEAGDTSVSYPPPTLHLFQSAHEQFGRLGWANLFQPAIGVAREGWLVRPHVHTVFTQNECKYGRMNYGDNLALSDDGKRLYLAARRPGRQHPARRHPVPHRPGGRRHPLWGHARIPPGCRDQGQEWDPLA